MYETPNYKISRAGIGGAILIGIVALLAIAGFLAVVVVAPNERAIPVVLGKASDSALQPGLSVVVPFVTQVERVNVATQRYQRQFPCFSSDLQTVTVAAVVVFTPKASDSAVRSVVVQYRGLDTAVASVLLPNVAEALKESTAGKTAETTVRMREEIKRETLKILRERVAPYDIFDINDVVIENIDLTDELERAIEAKMVQEQEAAKAKFTQEKARIDAETAVIQAKGESEALAVKGEALRKNPEILVLEGIQKWDGKTPHTLLMGGEKVNMSAILPPAPEKR